VESKIIDFVTDYVSNLSSGTSKFSGQGSEDEEIFRTKNKSLN